MQQAIRSPLARPSSVSSAKAVRLINTVAQARAANTGIRIGAVWRDALATFSAHSAAILLCALIGFAGPLILGAGLSTAIRLLMLARLSHPSVASYGTAISIAARYEGAFTIVLLLPMALSVIGMCFVRGAITWIALRESQAHDEPARRGRFSEAIRMTAKRYPALLVGSLFYGAIIMAGITGLSELTQPLEYNDGKLAHIWAELSRRFNYGLRQLVWRGLNTLLPDPGPPFAEFVSHWRKLASTSEYESQLRIPHSVAASNAASGLKALGASLAHRRSEFWLIVLGSLALIVAAETLLRFRTVMAFKPPEFSQSFKLEQGGGRLRRFTAFDPLLDSARFAIEHLRTIVVHVWLLRLALFALSIVFIELPLAAMDHFVAPNVIRFGAKAEFMSVMGLLGASSAAIASAILLAFSVVYDARLYAALVVPRR